MSERYHLGGRVETDTVAMAAARQDQAGIQRRHRLEHRQGDDPSQTPPFTSLVARHEVSQDTEEPQPQLLINPALPNQPRRGRGRSSLPRPSLTHDPIVLPSLGVDVDVPVCPMIPSILPRLGLDFAPPSDSVAAGDAMSAAHWARVKSFRQALYDEKEYCSQCHEEWINIQLNRDTVCHRCELKDKDKEPPLFSENTCRR
jgi:hypothetical protein